MTTVAAPERRQSVPADLAHNARLWALVDQIQADPERMAEPFGELYRLTYDTVFGFIRSRIGSRHDAEDIAAEVYLRAHKRVGRLRNTGSSPAAWLVTIAKNLVADHYKSAPVRLSFPVPSFDGAPREDGREARPPLGETYDRTEADAGEILTAITLYGAITRLTPDQHEAVRLRYLLGASIAVTAESMGKDQGAIKALTYRAARRMLRDPEVAALSAARPWLAA